MTANSTTRNEMNDAELDLVTGGTSTPTLVRTSTIVLPHIPQAKDLLTPQQIATLLSFNPPVPVPHG